VEYFLALLWWFNGFKSSFQTANQPLLFAGVVLLILTEIIVRYVFYASYYRVGV
jgi:DMSO reductase anchor subunit